MEKIDLGLIGIVNEAARRDYWGTMARVAAAGYRGIEGDEDALLAGDVAANLARFHELGLRVLAIGGTREALRGHLPGLIARAHALQADRVCCWWAPAESRDQLLADAELYNAAGAALAAEGIRLCYHHHAHELQTFFNGVAALDLLAAHTDPRALFFEVDIAWATVGGEDPVRLLHRYAGRVPAIHVKDICAAGPSPVFTALGTGVVDVAGSVRAAIATGVPWAVVEQDRLRNLDAFQTITLGALHLRELGLAE